MRFALEMENGVQVRDLKKLKENFSLKQIIPYFLDGRLKKWLEDVAQEEQLAQEVDALDKNDPMVSQKLCELFDVEYKPESNEDENTVEDMNQKDDAPEQKFETSK